MSVDSVNPEAEWLPELFNGIDDAVRSLNGLLLTEESPPRVDGIDRRICNLVKYAAEHFNQASTWGLFEIRSEWHIVLKAAWDANFNYLNDNKTEKMRWDDIKTEQLKKVSVIITGLNKLETDLKAENQKKVEQTDLARLAEKVAALEQQVSKDSEEIKNLRETIRDLQESHRSQKRSWFS